MAKTKLIEEKFIFTKELSDVNYISDGEGQVLGFNKLDNGNNIIFTKDLEGVDVAIEHCADGTKIFHMEKDSKGLPAMHEMKPDGTEIIYLFDENKIIEKMIEMKNNGDKVTAWFSPNGDEIVQEQRQKGGTLFKMKSGSEQSTIWLHSDGNLELHGPARLNKHLQSVFPRVLDGIEIE